MLLRSTKIVKRTKKTKIKQNETGHKSKKCDAPLLWKSKHLEGDSDMVSA